MNRTFSTERFERASKLEERIIILYCSFMETNEVEELFETARELYLL